MATGAYIRWKRDGQWQNIEVDGMTDAELDALAGQPASDPQPPKEG